MWDEQDGFMQKRWATASLRQVLLAVQAEETIEGKASTRQIAMRVLLSESQVWRYLTLLEKAGCVQRIGQRGGWSVITSPACQQLLNLSKEETSEPNNDG